MMMEHDRKITPFPNMVNQCFHWLNMLIFGQRGPVSPSQLTRDLKNETSLKLSVVQSLAEIHCNSYSHSYWCSITVIILFISDNDFKANYYFILQSYI